MLPHLVGHGVGHHDAADDDDQDEVECVHEAGTPGLTDLGATAVGAASISTAAGQLGKEHSVFLEPLLYRPAEPRPPQVSYHPSKCPTHRARVNS